MGGGGSGMTKRQKYYQEQQLALSQQANELQAEALALQKASITESEKKVDSTKKAASDTAKAQELRRGLSSAFSRDSVGKAASGGSATSGVATKLGE